jgi:histidyl-tRNA synthetase
MANTKPARGMRDFLPSEVRKRNYVIGIIKEVYESYGFEPLETPSVENLETLTGKYGEEGNQLIFKILKRGEKLQEELTEGKIKSENDLSDLALRYDLTVPLARVVANHKNDLPKFFKRYQIQPVWRADRPAKGRFREFYQCDVDAIGSNSMMVESELISAVCEILQRLGFEDFVIRINHRKVLAGMLSVHIEDESKHTDVLIALDKLDKIGTEGVIIDMIQKGIDEEDAEHFIEIFINLQKGISGYNVTKTINTSILNSLENKVLTNSDVGKVGISDLRKLIEFANITSANSHLKVDPTLARGLSYYTGSIFEINVPDLAGSLGGGGRYDGLIGMFGKEQIPACGFSLGLERILVVMEERGMFPKELTENSADVLVTVWNEESIGESLKLAAELRKENLRVLVYSEADKLGKQFKYADSIKIPFVCVLGESELAENKVTLKNLQTGEQNLVERKEVAANIKSK